ncbi:uncharacterized protein SRS1_14942 [Sporisorium reilianum f. sp. reilianum]|uniref:Uncharacterized protein n=1 Tax=Sporisorium reilianum f. sp. reilianum TaxID=72559 RepID=A0A2N8UH56_9BASI|nr:uncharacterized protein SRS1_14942 [Sporisorium reilianum f. sp. reilianum]
MFALLSGVISSITRVHHPSGFRYRPYATRSTHTMHFYSILCFWALAVLAGAVPPRRPPFVPDSPDLDLSLRGTHGYYAPSPSEASSSAPPRPPPSIPRADDVGLSLGGIYGYDGPAIPVSFAPRRPERLGIVSLSVSGTSSSIRKPPALLTFIPTLEQQNEVERQRQAQIERIKDFRSRAEQHSKAFRSWPNGHIKRKHYNMQIEMVKSRARSAYNL